LPCLALLFQFGGVFLTADFIEQLDAFFLPARLCGFCNEIKFASLLFAADQTLF
jgi:hypothetical protein